MSYELRVMHNKIEKTSNREYLLRMAAVGLAVLSIGLAIAYIGFVLEPK